MTRLGIFGHTVVADRSAGALHRDAQKDDMFRHLTAFMTLAALTLADVRAQAPPSDYRTFLTFSAPVTLPGVTLPAGTYLFRVADATSSRKVINVLSADDKQSLAMLLAVPNQLLSAPQNPEVQFMENAEHTVPAIKTWWYPGKALGYEFIYPRAQALALAKATSEPVLTTATETPDLETAELARVTAASPPAPVIVDENPAPVAVAPGRVQQGKAVADSASVLATQQARNGEHATAGQRTRLPRTASSIPIGIVFGGAALLAGLVLLLWRPPHFSLGR